jgi:SNF2 family DNA or RNA helicase
MRLGLTGTPIENSLLDLHALLELGLPGYLGTRAGFRTRFADPIENADDARARDDLRRLIAPFVLRRLKRTVLDQLPEKIEDTRSCALSAQQVRLYREAIASRGSSVRAALEDPGARVPYMHIFALLSLLKQICCHPALLEKRRADQIARYREHQSGKWELFVELLDESLGSGHKVVVYSQFLGMLGIMEQHLRERGVGYGKLTGATRKRGEVIARFADDPECRVFLASLQAGGVGIDLVSASVVIHYDRWWNAAREDQATDRVHRLGQTRGVQVLKLVSEGTLEEKIAALIRKRRELLNSVVGHDDNQVLKQFSRAELLELLELAPGG